MQLKHLVLTVALLGQASLAQAQDDPRQTPENANKFLVLNLNNVSLSGEGDMTGYISARTENIRETGDPCSIDIGYAGKRNYMNRTGDQTVFPHNFTLHFRSVTDIQYDDSSVSLAVSTLIDGTRMHKIRLGQPSKEMATRVAFAMNFLKSHCNPADQTGF